MIRDDDPILIEVDEFGYTCLRFDCYHCERADPHSYNSYIEAHLLRPDPSKYYDIIRMQFRFHPDGQLLSMTSFGEDGSTSIEPTFENFSKLHASMGKLVGALLFEMGVSQRWITEGPE